MSPNSPDGIFVGDCGRAQILRIQGRGTFKTSPSLKQYCLQRLEKGTRDFIFDFDQCAGMDSTFMGVLAGLASRLGGERGPVKGINLGPKIIGLLETLGLDEVMELYPRGETPEKLPLSSCSEDLKQLETKEPGRLEAAEVMLEAHQELVDLSPENLPKFKDVLTFIREDLDQLRKEEQDK